MKLRTTLLVGVLVTLGVSLPTWAQTEPSHKRLGAEKEVNEFTLIEIKNFQDESLGKISELGLDLVNGRIVEVFVAVASSLDAGGKIVAVPPLAIFPDQANEVYRINISAEEFKNAAAIDFKKWEEVGRSDRVAAAYRLFGQDPYFLENGETSSATDSRPKVTLGYVERSNKILNLPVGNFKGEQFGKVWSMTLDIPRGRILNVIILAPGNFLTKSIVPAMALSFNAKRDALLLDDTKKEFADEPRLVFTDAANGQPAYYHRENYKGPHTSVALEQGYSYRDIDKTIRINKEIRVAKINARNVEVGTINDRVTLRGWVNTGEDRRRIGEIARAATMPEMVDNQLKVGKPAAGN